MPIYPDADVISPNLATGIYIYIYVFWASSLPGDTYAWSVSWTQSNGTRLTVYRETGGEGGLYKKKSI
jgi:hypothetical protein